MEDYIEEWRKRKSQAKKTHKKLVGRLSKVKEKTLTRHTENLHTQVFEKIDCLDCANCCTSIPPIINETDVRRIAKYLGMKVAQFKEAYVTIDEDQDMVLNQSPCHFLESDHKCSIYEVRPKACRQYPHTDNFEFAKNLKLHATNSRYCPAVFHILEKLKDIF